jgi:hypothetical protein
LEKKFFTMDEETARDNALTRIALGHAANSTRLQHKKSKEQKSNYRKKSDSRRPSTSTDKSAHAANSSQRTIVCYNCGKEGHVAPDCKAPKNDRKQQANTAQEK